MTSTQVWILVATIVGFIGIGFAGALQMVRIPWPSGPRMTRTSVLGTEVVVIDAPGAGDGEKLLLLDACTTATVAIFTAWRVWRPNDQALAFPLVGVHFIDDSVMDDIEHALFGGQKIASYLGDASSKLKRVPLAVIRKSLAGEMIGTGQPLMHEMLHALLNHFTPDEPGNKDHTGKAWDLVQGAARATYLDLYAPKVQLMKKPG
jgi:hypothetical protein